MICALLPLLILLPHSGAAFAIPTCTVASGATLSFGAVVALASTGDVTANSGGSFWVNCTSDVSTTPTLYSATARSMIQGGNTLPFTLSLVSPGGADLPATSPGAALSIPKDGTNRTVTLYGKIRAADFKGLPSGLYSRTLSLTVSY